MNSLQPLLEKPEFPRSNGYDSAWVLDNQMGPNVLWLTEWLADALPLHPGMRVLDLGCGRAASSIFLAREFGVQVWAADLWIAPDLNWERARAAGADARVFPIRAEAHALPFARGFFDAIVSVDAYQYFGTDTLYLAYISHFLRPGGSIGIVVPGLAKEFTAVPGHLATPQANGKTFWEDECWSFKTARWWHEHWSRTPAVTDLRVDTLPDGWRHWADFETALELAGKSVFPSDAEALEADGGRYIAFHRAVARRSEHEVMNLYDSSVGVRAGVDG
jgi:cyclopropane fatty-acyl-phospholipid synthase-like methyltransferase